MSALKPALLPKDGRGMTFAVGDILKAVPEGEYEVVLIDVVEGNYGGKRPRLDFSFEIRSGVHLGVRIKAFFNANYKKYSSYTKLYQWWTKVAGRLPEPDEQLSTDVFFDKVLRVRVKNTKSKMTKLDFSNVAEVLAVVGDL